MASDLSTAGCLPSAAHSLDRFAQERPLLPPLPQPAPSHLGGSARLPVVHTAVCTAGRCRGHTSARLHERVHQPLTQLIHSAGPPRMPTVAGNRARGASWPARCPVKRATAGCWRARQPSTARWSAQRQAARIRDSRLQRLLSHFSRHDQNARTCLLDARHPPRPAVDLFVLSRLSITIRLLG